jgi:hypothetical protein
MKNKVTKFIVYSRYGKMTHGFETANKVNFLTGNLKDETLYDSIEEANNNKDDFYYDVCEISSLIKIDRFIF